MATAAETSVALSRSDSAIPGSTVTGIEVVLSPAMKAALPPEVVTTGVWSVSATVMVRVAAVLLFCPSLTVKLMVRVALSGVTAVSV